VDLRHSDHDGTSPFFAAVHGKHAEIVVHLRSVCGVDEERVTENPFRHCSRNHVRRAHKEHAKKLEAQHQRDARCEQAMRQIMGPTRAYAAASARGQRDVRRLPCARPLRSGVAAAAAAAAAAAPTLATCSLLCLPAACRGVPAMQGSLRRFLLGRRSTRPSHIVGGGRSSVRAQGARGELRRAALRKQTGSFVAEMDRRVALQVRRGALPGRGGALAELGRVVG
jgi:hypothetical protein